MLATPTKTCDPIGIGTGICFGKLLSGKIRGRDVLATFVQNPENISNPRIWGNLDDRYKFRQKSDFGLFGWPLQVSTNFDDICDKNMVFRKCDK